MWKPYLHDRLISKHESGFYVIVPDGDYTKVPLSCPVCDYVFRTRDDESSFFEYSCCYRCALHWAHPDREKWKSGWRPSKSQIEEYEKERLPIVVTIE